MSNLIDTSKLVVGFIQRSNGAVKASSTGTDRVTDFIRVFPEKSYVIQFTPLTSAGWTWIGLAYFDENFNYLKEIDIVDVGTMRDVNETWVCPQNVTYVRLSAIYFESFISNFILVGNLPEPTNEKTILKLHVNGDFETVGTQLIQSQISNNYSFTNSTITVPTIIELPPYRNYFFESAIVPGFLERNGNIGSPTEGEITSDFINVEGWENVTIRIHYEDMNDRYWAWRRISFFTSQKTFLNAVDEGIINGVSKGDYTYTVNVRVPANVAFLRVSTNYYQTSGVTVKVSVEKGITTNTKHYPAIEDIDIPAWVRDTGQPISFFEEGIVIKGDLIHTGQEPEPPESNVLFMDDFNRADTNTLGDNWIDGRGSWGIENNMVKPTIFNSIALCVHPHGDNVSISSDVKRVRSDGVIFRGRDANNHLYVQFENADFKLKSLTNGVVTTLKTFNLNSVLNQIYRVRIELRGVEIKVFVDDVLCITHETSSYLNENLCGYQSWSTDGNNGRFDNFIIEKLPNHVIFEDDFNRPNAETLGGNWIVPEGSFSVSNNTALPTNQNTTNNTAVTDVGIADNIRITLGVIVPRMSESLVFRFKDKDNYLHALIELGDLYLRYKLHGESGTLTSASLGAISGNPYKISVELRGQQVKIFVDDVQKISTIISEDNALLDATKHGMKAWTNFGTLGHFDNFKVEKLPINE